MEKKSQKQPQTKNTYDLNKITFYCVIFSFSGNFQFMRKTKIYHSSNPVPC